MSTSCLPDPYPAHTGSDYTPPSTLSDDAQLTYPSPDDIFTHYLSEMVTKAIHECQVAVNAGCDALGAKMDAMQRDIQEVKGELMATKLELGQTKKEVVNVRKGLSIINQAFKSSPSAPETANVTENIQTKLDALKCRLDEVAEGFKTSLTTKAVVHEIGVETENTAAHPESLAPYPSTIRSETLSESTIPHVNLSPPPQKATKPKKTIQLTEELIANALELDLRASSATLVDATSPRSASNHSTEVEVPEDKEFPLSRSNSQLVVQEELLATTPSRPLTPATPRRPPSPPSEQPPLSREETPRPHGPVINPLPVPDTRPQPQPLIEQGSRQGSRIRSGSITAISRLEQEELEPLTEISSSLSDEEDQLENDVIDPVSNAKSTVQPNKTRASARVLAGKKRKGPVEPSSSNSKSQKKVKIEDRSASASARRSKGKKQKAAVSWPECDVTKVLETPNSVVNCDGCSRFYHHLCAGLSEGDVRLKEDEIFICPLCVYGQAGEGFGKGREVPFPQCSRPACPVEIYYVEKLVGRRPSKDGADGFLYLVKWIDYGLCDCTWEPASNFESERLKVFAESAVKEGIDLDKTPDKIILLKEAEGETGTWKDWEGGS